MNEDHDETQAEDPFAIFDDLEFDDIEAGERDQPIKVGVKKVSTGVQIKLLIRPEMVKEMDIKEGDFMKLQGADLDESIALKISKSGTPTKTVVKKNTVGARAHDENPKDFGMVVNFTRMTDMGIGAYSGTPDLKDRTVRDGALILILDKGENEIVAKKPRQPKARKAIASNNPSGIVFDYYGNGRYKPTVESDEHLERMITSGKSMDDIVVFFGGQAKPEDLRRRYNQLKEM